MTKRVTFTVPDNLVATLVGLVADLGVDIVIRNVLPEDGSSQPQIHPRREELQPRKQKPRTVGSRRGSHGKFHVGKATEAVLRAGLEAVKGEREISLSDMRAVADRFYPGMSPSSVSSACSVACQARLLARVGRSRYVLTDKGLHLAEKVLGKDIATIEPPVATEKVEA